MRLSGWEFKEFEELQEYKERSQEPESRSQETLDEGRCVMGTTALSKKLGSNVRNLVGLKLAGPRVSGPLITDYRLF
jgi:hypothetical protein